MSTLKYPDMNEILGLYVGFPFKPLIVFYTCQHHNCGFNIEFLNCANAEVALVDIYVTELMSSNKKHGMYKFIIVQNQGILLECQIRLNYFCVKVELL